MSAPIYQVRLQSCGYPGHSGPGREWRQVCKRTRYGWRAIGKPFQWGFWITTPEDAKENTRRRAEASCAEWQNRAMMRWERRNNV